MDKPKRSEVRARAEARFDGTGRLWRKAWRVGLYFILFALMNFTLWEWIPRESHNPFFLYYNSDFNLWFRYEVWGWVAAAYGLLFGVCLLSLFVDLIREGIIQWAIQREMRLETLRLQLALEEARNGRTLSGEGEKVKHVMVLTDDGELVTEGEETGLQTSRGDESTGAGTVW